MLQNLRSLTLASRLALFALLAILFVLSCLTFYAVTASRNALIATEVEGLKQKNQLVVDLIEAYDQSLRGSAQNFLTVLRNLYPTTFMLSHSTTQVGNETVPILLADSDPINNENFQVDKFQELTAGVATVFVKRGEDFVRISTSLRDADKERVIGTTLAKDNPAYGALSKGEQYVGPVVLFSNHYLAAYEPIRNLEKEIIGAFFVGIDFNSGMAALKRKIKDIKIGQSGYFIAIDATPGPSYGTMLVHPSLKGQNALEVRDADGNFVLKNSLSAKSGVATYRWIGEGDSKPREKVASFLTYEKWHWLILGSSYVDEFGAQAKTLSRYLVLASLLSGLLLAGVLYYLISRNVGKPLEHAAAIAQSVAAGDLTQKITIGRDDETGKLLASLQTMSDGLAHIARTVYERSALIQEGARQIAMGNLDVSQRTEEQASTLEETMASVETVSAAARENATIAAQGRKLATDAAHAAAENANVMARLSETINSMHSSSKQISEIVGVIDGLAFQTNILALNAAVEAARAGEQGRGFAVVASEVRSLAHRSSQSAKDIRAIIAKSTAAMDAGSKLAQEVARSSHTTQRSIQTVTGLMGQIADCSREQSGSIEQINQAMSQLDGVTQQNAALVEQASAAAQSLEEQSYHLLEAVKQLRFEGTDSRQDFAALSLREKFDEDSNQAVSAAPALASRKKLLRALKS